MCVRRCQPSSYRFRVWEDYCFDLIGFFNTYHDDDCKTLAAAPAFPYMNTGAVVFNR